MNLDELKSERERLVYGSTPEIEFINTEASNQEASI